MHAGTQQTRPGQVMRKLNRATCSCPTHTNLLLAIVHMYGEINKPLCVLAAWGFQWMQFTSLKLALIQLPMHLQLLLLQHPVTYREWLSRWVWGDRELFASSVVAMIHVASSLDFCVFFKTELSMQHWNLGNMALRLSRSKSNMQHGKVGNNTIITWPMAATHCKHRDQYLQVLFTL